jgi:transposase
MKLAQQRARNEIIINMLKQGFPQDQIAKAVSLSTARVSQLVNSYRSSPETFFDNKYQGYPPKLSSYQKLELEDIILKGAEEYGFQGDVWTSERVQIVIKENFGKDYHVQYIPRLLRSMNFSLQKPRMTDVRKSKEAVRTWLKTKLPAIKKSPE